MNTTLLSGRISKDPELRYTQSNTAVTSFDLAVDRRDENKNTDFFPCVAWKKTGELVANYCSKGDKVTIRGRLQNRTWEDKDGGKHKVTEIIVDEVEFQPKKEAAPEAPKPEAPKAKPKEIPEPGYFDPLDDSSLPF